MPEFVVCLLNYSGHGPANVLRIMFFNALRMTRDRMGTHASCLPVLLSEVQFLFLA